MEKGIPEKFADSIIRNTITLDRFAEGTKEKVVQILTIAQNEIVGAIAEIDPHAPSLTEWRTNRYLKLNKKISDILSTRYGEIKKETNTDLKGMMNPLAEKTLKDFNSAIGVNIFDVTLTPENLNSIVNNTLIDGKVIGEWWDKQELTTKDRLQVAMNKARQELEVGAVKGESIGELVGRIRGTKLTPGEMVISKREAEALVRTSTLQVANATRMKIYEQNQDIFDGYEVIATLDKRTTPLCRGLDRKRFDLNFKPIGHNTSYPIGGPPFHWNCRTTIIPITKSYQDLVAEGSALSKRKKDLLANVPVGLRASMGGPVQGAMDYTEWLKTQDLDVQIEVLGKTRQELWSRNMLTMADMLHQSGRQLTLKELRVILGSGEEIAERRDLLFDLMEQKAMQFDSLEDFKMYLATMPERETGFALIKEEGFTPESFYKAVRRADVIKDDFNSFLLTTDEDLFIKASLDKGIVSFGGKVSYDLSDPAQKAQFEKILNAYVQKYKTAMIAGKEPAASHKVAFGFLSPEKQAAVLRKIDEARLKVGAPAIPKVEPVIVPKVGPTKVIPEIVPETIAPTKKYFTEIDSISAVRDPKVFSAYKDLKVGGVFINHVDDLPRINAIGKELERLYLEFPEIVKRMDKVELGMFEFGESKYLHPRKRCMGVYWPSLRKIAVGKVDTITDGSIAIGKEFSCKNVEGIARHEFGHHLWETLSPTERRRFRKIYKSFDPEYLSSEVSGYSATNFDELWAEAFRYYTHKNYEPGDLPEAIEKFFMELFPKEKGIDKISAELLADQQWRLKLAGKEPILFEKGMDLPASIFKKVPDDFKVDSTMIKMEFDPGTIKVSGKKWASSGTIMMENDGKIWLMKDEKGNWVFPKAATMDKAPDLVGIDATFRRTGMTSDIIGYLGDYEGGSSVTRYYIGEMTGGIPGIKGDLQLISLDDALTKGIFSGQELKIATDLQEHYQMAMRLGNGDFKKGLTKVAEEMAAKGKFTEFLSKTISAGFEIEIPEGFTYAEKLAYAKKMSQQMIKNSVDGWVKVKTGAEFNAMRELGFVIEKQLSMDDFILVKQRAIKMRDEAREYISSIKPGSLDEYLLKSMGRYTDSYEVVNSILGQRESYLATAREDLVRLKTLGEHENDLVYWMHKYPKPDDMDAWEYLRKAKNASEELSSKSSIYMEDFIKSIPVDDYFRLRDELIKVYPDYSGKSLIYRVDVLRNEVDRFIPALAKWDELAELHPDIASSTGMFPPAESIFTKLTKFERLIKVKEDAIKAAARVSTEPVAEMKVGKMLKDLPPDEVTVIKGHFYRSALAGKLPASGSKARAAWESLDRSEHKRLIDAWVAKGKTFPESFMDMYYPKAGVEVSVPKTAATPKPIPPAFVDTKIKVDLKDFTEYNGGSKGSNPGGYYYSNSNPADRYYFKFLDEDRVHNEILANKLYKLAGVEVPEVGVVIDAEGKAGLASRIIDGLENNVSKLTSGKITGIEDGFIVDCWLANWDVVGAGYDNMLIKDGLRAIRADNGGALLFRARGGKKGGAFGKEVSEIEGLRDSKKNPTSSKIFKNVTRAHMKAGAKKLATITDDQIKKLVDEYSPNLSAYEKENMVDILIGRRDYITDYFVEYERTAAIIPEMADLTTLQAQTLDVAKVRGAIKSETIQALKKHGFTRSEINQLSQKVYEQMRFCTNIPLEEGPYSDVYKALFKAPELKNQFVRGTGGEGAQCPFKGSSRDKWEKILSNGILWKNKVYKTMSKHQYFTGSAETLEAAWERPYYGYVFDVNNPHAARQYGDFTAIMKKGFENRSTFTLGNSSALEYDLEKHGMGMDNNPLLKTMAKRVSTGDLQSIVKGEKNLNAVGFDYGGYIEAQMYGRLRLDRDVELFVWHGRTIPDYIQKFADRWEKEIITEQEWVKRCRNQK